jgi:ectoine hydroxylase-related dioxygenase (phytanoyl-CoA dioxygenase family)
LNKQPLNPITAEHAETYARDGVVCLRGMFDNQWVEALRAAALDAIAHPERYSVFGPSHSEEFSSIIYLWRHPGMFRQFVLESPAAEIVGRVLSAREIRAFQDHLFVKPVGSPHILPWHHDASTWPIRGHQVPTLWVALSEVDHTNGRLEFVAGQHQQLVKDDVIYRTGYKRGTFGPSSGVPCPDFEQFRSDPAYRFVTSDLAPGDALLFHPRTPHSSGHALHARHERIGLSSRWVGDDITWHRRDGAVGVPGMDTLPEGERPDGPLFPMVWRQ